MTPAAVSARTPQAARTRRAVTLAVVCAANFLVLADATIVNVALPTIGRAMALSALRLPWVVNCYAFAFGGCLLLGGRAADRLGPRRVFTAGMLTFTAGSLACGLAGSAPALFAGRVIQGVGGALACPAALSVIAVTFPAPDERVRALAGWTAAGAGAVALGPVIGGVLTASAGWPSVFLVPVPLCLAAAAGGLRAVPPGRGRQPVSGVRPGPPFPFRRTLAADLVLALTSAALVGACYASTLWLQDILRYGPLPAGLAFLPLSGGIVAGSVAAPALIRHLGLRRVAVTGLAVAVAAMMMLARTPAQAGLPDLLPWLAVLAVGFGVQSVPVSMVATSVPGREALASALYQTAGQLGGGAGLAVLSAAAHASAGSAHAGGLDAVFAGGTMSLAAATLTAVALLRPADAEAVRRRTAGHVVTRSASS
jgi:predicted MFS family arabinose efflux permease